MRSRQMKSAAWVGGRRIRRHVLAALCGSAFLLAPALPAAAMPAGGAVVGGAAAGVIGTAANNALTITQHADKMIVNWQDFSVKAGETVNFQQNASQIALNRVVGGNLSEINGRINAGGQVFLINPNGVLFGQGAEVNAGGLVASAKGISDDDFKAGTYAFQGKSEAAVINRGRINITADQGYAALVGAMVKNEGVIASVKRETKAVLAAGEGVTLNLDHGAFDVQVDAAAVQATIDNKGAIGVGDGRIYMTAKAANELYASVIHTGEAKAGKIVLEGGVVSLKSADAPQLDGATEIKAGKEIRAGVDGIQASLATPDNVTLTGTAQALTPYQRIHNVAELQAIKDHLDANYMLAGDIDARATEHWNQSGLGSPSDSPLDYQGFDPLGDSMNAFSGTLDGMGFGIDRLTIRRNGNDEVGLFGANQGMIANLNFTNGSIAGKDYVGAVAGVNSGDIVNVHHASRISGQHYVGGIVGKNTGAGSVAFSVNEGFVAGTQYIGGIAGGNDGYIAHVSNRDSIGRTGDVAGGIAGYNGGVITDAKNSGAVAGNDWVGGIAGENANGAQMDRVGNSAPISGATHVGGLIGGNAGSLQNGANLGAVAGTGAEIGGVAGNNAAAGSMASVYNSNTVEGGDDTGGVVGVNEGALTEAYNTGQVIGGRETGGVAGANKGSLTNVFNTGMVAGGQYIGGVVGKNTDVVKNAYNTGATSGTSETGGLAGSNEAGAALENAYNIGSVDAVLNGGAAAGENQGIFKQVYWLDATAAQATGSGNASGSEKKTRSELENFTGMTAGFDSAAWRFEVGKSAPMLAFAKPEDTTRKLVETAAGGHAVQCGTAADPFLFILNGGGALTLDWNALRLGDRDGLYQESGKLTVEHYQSNTGHYGMLGGKELTILAEGNYRNYGALQADRLTIVSEGTIVLDLDRVYHADGAPKTNHYETIALQAPDIKLGYTPQDAAGPVQGHAVADYAAYDAARYQEIQTGSVAPLTGMWVHDVYDLQNMDGNLNGVYLLYADINAGDTANWNGGKGFKPVADYLDAVAGQKYFTGTFDGLGQKIDQMMINRTARSDINIGLFGSNQGVIRDVGMNHGSYRFGWENAGSLVGYNAGVIHDVYNTGDIGKGTQVGGLVGRNAAGGSISNGYNTGMVIVGYNPWIGGIVGINDGSVENCYNFGLVSGSELVGGIAGVFANGTMRNVYNLGSVFGSGIIGGIAGEMGYSSGSTGGVLDTAYNLGAIWSSTSYIGGICGRNGGRIQNVYNAGSVTQVSVSHDHEGYVGGIAGENAGGSGRPAVITNVYNTGAVSGYVYVGGIVGNNQNFDGIDGVYNAGVVTARGTGGATVGSVSGSGNILHGYWQTGTIVGNNGIGEEVSAADMMRQDSFAGFDFSGAWRIYDGHTMPLLKAFLTSLRIGGTDQALHYDGGEQFVTAAAPSGTKWAHIASANDSYTVKNAGTYTLGDVFWSDQHGYDIIVEPIVVQKATLQLTVNDVAMVYGQAESSVRNQYGYRAAGLLGGDTLETALGGATIGYANEAYRADGTTRDVSNGYRLNLTGVDASTVLTNYEIAAVNPGQVTMEKAKLTLTAGDVQMTYGQSEAAVRPQYGYGVAGLVNGDTRETALSGATIGYANEAYRADGTTKDVANGYQLNLTGADAGTALTNYEIEAVNPGQVTMEKAKLTLTAGDVQMTYGQSEAAVRPQYGYGVAGLVNGDTRETALSGATIGYANEAYRADGTTKDVANGYHLNLTGADAGTALTNYEIAAVNPGQVTMEKAKLTLMAGDVQMTYGQSEAAVRPQYGYGVAGLVNGDARETALSGVTIGYANEAYRADGTTKDVANGYHLNLTGADAGTALTNYEIVAVNPGQVTMEKATLTFTADFASGLAGDALPELGGQLTGFVNGDSLPELGGTVDWNTEATQTSSPGLYGIYGSARGGEYGNYDFAQAPTNAAALRLLPKDAPLPPLPPEEEDSRPGGYESVLKIVQQYKQRYKDKAEPADVYNLYDLSLEEEQDYNALHYREIDDLYL